MDKEKIINELIAIKNYMGNSGAICGYGQISDLIDQLQSSQSEGKSEKKALADRDAIITLLDDYSKYLEENGFLDTDWKAEKTYAIDDFLSKDRKPPV